MSGALQSDPSPVGVAAGGFTSGKIDVGEVTLHYMSHGDGPPVVLLHGFPEFWYSWRRQIPALADAGFHAVAPDLRGYNESDRPTDIDSYRMPRLVTDIVRLIEGVGRGPAFIVGHDWGGVIAWRLAALYPELVRRLVILNAPHPSAFSRELMRSPLQWVRSSYALFFQLPWLPEQIIRSGNYALLDKAFGSQPVHRSAFSEADIAEYKRALDRPGALTGPLNYYRAAARYQRDLSAAPQYVPTPTMLLWGEQDPFLGTGLTEGLQRWVPELRTVRIPDSSHWVQNDVPERVNQLLISFFREEQAP